MITVIVPTVDRPDLLSEALESLANQTYLDFDVIVVNDGGASIETLVQLWRRRFPLRLIELPTTRGAAVARNAAIEHARGEYLAFLDDDDIHLPSHLETTAKILSATGADFAYTGAVVADRRVTSLPPDSATMHLKAYEYDDDFLLVANYIHTGSIVVRNFRDTGVRFDESLPVCEDWDLWIGLTRMLRYRVAFTTEVTSIYHQVAGARGLVLHAQRMTPSPFGVIRERIHGKWPSDAPHVVAYRQWLTNFESYRNRHISENRPVPTHLFDRVLQHLHGAFVRQATIDASSIRDLFH